MTNTEKLGVAGIIIGGVAIIYSAFIHSRINKTADIINASIDDVSKNINIDVPQSIVDKAVDKAVEREVNKAVKTISYEVSESLRRDIKNKVKAAVDESYSDIKASVSSEVSKDVANIDLKQMRREVKEKASQLVIDKFNENLDSLLQDFNQNLNNVSKIYSSIADNMTKKPQETILKIGG